MIIREQRFEVVCKMPVQQKRLQKIRNRVAPVST